MAYSSSVKEIVLAEGSVRESFQIDTDDSSQKSTGDLFSESDADSGFNTNHDTMVKQFGSSASISVPEHQETQDESSSNDSTDHPETQGFLLSYTLEDVKREGSYGKYCLVHDNTELKEKHGLIKIDTTNLFPEQKEELKNIVKNTLKFQHPVLMRYWACNSNPSTFSIFTEPLLWETMEEHVKTNGGVTEMVLRSYISPILDGLEYMHQQNFTHGDIRCKNIYKGPDGRIKLGGYSVEKKVEEWLCESQYSYPATMNFTPPESEMTPKSDIWSLGCTIVEMLSGGIPWKGLKRVELAKFIRECRIPLSDVPGMTPLLKEMLTSKVFVKETKRSSSSDLKLDAWVTDADSDTLGRQISDTHVQADSERGRITQAEVRKWKFGEKIGSGAFGDVLLFFNETMGEQRAVKRFKSKDENGEKCKDREIKASCSLKHNNIVRCFGYFNVSENREGEKLEEERLYLVMELMKGSLEEKIKSDGPLSEKKTKHYTRQILFGLQYMHQMGFIHRDIKGANILLDENDTAKIGDLGFVKELGPGISSLLPSGEYSGTLLWNSPEVINQSEPCGKKADIWSLGCTVVEMMTTKPPYGNVKKITERMVKLATHEGVPILPTCSAASHKIKTFLKRIFVEKRLRPSCIELLNDEWISVDGS